MPDNIETIKARLSERYLDNDIHALLADHDRLSKPIDDEPTIKAMADMLDEAAKREWITPASELRQAADIIRGQLVIMAMLAARAEAAEAERDEAWKLAEKCRADRALVLSVETTDGLSASEWLMRTAAAESVVKRLEDDGLADRFKTSTMGTIAVSAYRAAVRGGSIIDRIKKANVNLTGGLTPEQAVDEARGGEPKPRPKIDYDFNMADGDFGCD